MWENCAIMWELLYPYAVHDAAIENMINLFIAGESISLTSEGI